MTLEDTTDEILREPNPTADAVTALIKVEDRKKGKQSSDIELKTDLNHDEVKVHSVLQVLNSTLEMTEKEFQERCILGGLINSKERKLVSKDRGSRREIVEVARNPDTTISQSEVSESFVKKFMSPRK